MMKNKENILYSVKSYIQEAEEGLLERHIAGATGTEIMTSYTLLIDSLISSIFHEVIDKLPKAKNVSLIALGGYGRRELNIRSDIDIMLLYQKRLSIDIKELAEKLLHALWNCSLDIGFSVRSLKGCIDLAKEDLKTKTAVLDSRFLVGAGLLFKEFERMVLKNIFTVKGIREFVDEKLLESRERHAKYGGSVYILEPNIKEGEGGLRDFHSILWIAKAMKKIRAPEELLGTGLLAEEEFSELKEAIDFLWRVRNDMHFASKRKTDQLTFDHQVRIAKVFDYLKSHESLAVEKFMIDYYRYASTLNHYSSITISRLLHGGDSAGKLHKKEKVIDEDFRLYDGTLLLADKDVSMRTPQSMIRAFKYAQDYNAKLDSIVKDFILKNLDSIDDKCRASKVLSEVFLAILKEDSAFEPLIEMHKLRLLGKYLPEFQEISHRMQHDLYHVYTVDVHSLFAVRELEKLAQENEKKYPILSRLYEEVEKHDILKLAVLLHDIGKSRGKGHAEKGADMTVKIAKRLGLDEDDTALLVFLVRNHLILADTAQYRDLHDEKLIVDFAKRVGNVERLNLLFLLTFADLRAVGPDVWTKWKSALLQELFLKALSILKRGSFETEDKLKKLPKIKEAILDAFAGKLTRNVVEKYFQLLPQRYFLSNSTDVIAEHIRLIQGLQGKPFVLKVNQCNNRQYTEVIICTADLHGLFSDLTGVMVANGINIIGAQINTLKNGIALDVLQAKSTLGGMITDEAKWKAVERDIEAVITGVALVENIVKRRKPSILDKKIKPRVHTRITIDNVVSDTFTVIDIHAQDSIGLLYTITKAIFDLGLYINVAKISTNGDEVADIFYVKDIFGQKVYYKKRLKEIRYYIYKAMGEEPPDDEEFYGE